MVAQWPWYTFFTVYLGTATGALLFFHLDLDPDHNQIPSPQIAIEDHVVKLNQDQSLKRITLAQSSEQIIEASSSDYVYFLSVPQLEKTFAVIPGQENHLNFSGLNPGDYLVPVAEMCGRPDSVKPVNLNIR
jgi:heme/copper-type cytochrome/quinol oxidase subunit 2